MESQPILFCTVEGCKLPRADQYPKATNRHCSQHKTEANRRGNATRLEQQHGKGYVKGVEDMRELLAREFEALGAGEFNGVEAAFYIRQAPGPIAEPEHDNASRNGASDNTDKKKGPVTEPVSV